MSAPTETRVDVMDRLQQVWIDLGDVQSAIAECREYCNEDEASLSRLDRLIDKEDLILAEERRLVALARIDGGV